MGQGNGWISSCKPGAWPGRRPRRGPCRGVGGSPHRDGRSAGGQCLV